MAKFSDLSEEVFRRALESLETKLPTALHTRLVELVSSGEIADAKAVAEAIAKHVDNEAVDGSNK